MSRTGAHTAPHRSSRRPRFRLWIEQTEGAKFWLKVMNELRTRGVGDILIAVVDGLTGFPDAIAAVFPQTAVQTCIVHLIRNSLAFVSWKDRKKVMPDLKAIYRAETAEAAAATRQGLTGLGEAWRESARSREDGRASEFGAG